MLPASESHSCSVAGSHLSLLVRRLLGAVVEASIQKALCGLTLKVLPGAHKGGVVNQGVEELPVLLGPFGTGHFVLLLLLMDQLDT